MLYEDYTGEIDLCLRLMLTAVDSWTGDMRTLSQRRETAGPCFIFDLL